MRLSIPRHHQQYISSLASEMGCSNAEALNWLIWTHRWGTPQPQPQQASQIAFTPKSPQAIQQFEQSQLQQEIDPIIEKLATLIEDF
jgi:hypothetical protein